MDKGKVMSLAEGIIQLHDWPASGLLTLGLELRVVADRSPCSWILKFLPKGIMDIKSWHEFKRRMSISIKGNPLKDTKFMEITPAKEDHKLHTAGEQKG